MTFGSLILLGLGLTGCAEFAPIRNPAPSEFYETARIPDLPAESRALRFWGDQTSDEEKATSQENYERYVTQAWVRAGRPNDGIETNILAISGGGPNGAFAAGLLKGWSENGTRPSFDLVTGISVGALIAPFAYLGPDYDSTLRQIFTEFGTERVAIFEPIAVLFGARGIADTTPLRETIAEFVDRPMLKAVAREYGKERDLLIGTTDLDSGRSVIWNMGAIAAAGKLELFRDIMLASASVPGVFPPVEIEVEVQGKRFKELHVDGGVTHSVIVWPFGFEASLDSRPFSFPIRQTVYIIQNNTLDPVHSPVEAWIPEITARSLNTLIRAQTLGDLNRIYMAAVVTGSEFRLAFMPPELTPPGATDFDVEYMRMLYAAAYADAITGIDWRLQPPGLVGGN